MKKTKIKTQAIIFDMDGVITHTMPDHFRAWNSVLKNSGIRVNRFDVYQREGQKGLVSICEIFKERNLPLKGSQARKILKNKEELFKSIVKVRFVRGSRSFIKDLYRKRFQLALVTGTSRHEMHKTLPLQILKLFSVIITGSDVRKGKPNPEPFLKALRKLNIKPIDAIVIENSPLGIQSSLKAGLRCLALETSLPKKFLKKATIVFPTIDQLRKKVDFIRPQFNGEFKHEV